MRKFFESRWWHTLVLALALFAGSRTAALATYNPNWSASSGSSATLFYGDGSSGSATMDGSTVCFGLTPSGNVYTATANIYATSLTIDAGVTLNMDQFQLYVSGTLTLNGAIRCDGGAGSGSTGGAGISAGVYFVVGAGTNGSSVIGNGPAGGSGTGGSPFGGGGGGGGGTGGSQGSPGIAGTPSVLVNQLIRSGFFPMAVLSTGQTTLPAVAGYGQPGSAGGGRGDGTNPGGGSGARGGLLVVRARAIAMGASGLISAKGGNGASAAAMTGTDLGGGGGGAGGCAVLYYGSASGTALSSGVNVTAAGGSGGAGKGGGTSGGNGVSGSVFILQGQ